MTAGVSRLSGASSMRRGRIRESAGCTRRGIAAGTPGSAGAPPPRPAPSARSAWPPRSAVPTGCRCSCSTGPECASGARGSHMGRRRRAPRTLARLGRCRENWRRPVGHAAARAVREGHVCAFHAPSGLGAKRRGRKTYLGIHGGEAYPRRRARRRTPAPPAPRRRPHALPGVFVICASKG
jgi:hypothetical protein